MLDKNEIIFEAKPKGGVKVIVNGIELVNDGHYTWNCIQEILDELNINAKVIIKG